MKDNSQSGHEDTLHRRLPPWILMADDYPMVTAPVSARQTESALLCAIDSEVEVVDVNFKRPFYSQAVIYPLY